MRKPYIGITGFMTKEEVTAMLDLMPLSSNRLLMVGILASWKTLYEGKESNRYPNINNIPEIISSHPLTLNLIHYHTRKTNSLCEQLSSLTMLSGKNLHGFQLNFTWPPKNELYKYRSICPNHIIVMVITPQAFEDVKYSPELLASRIEEYKGLVHYVLLDQSGGYGIPLDTEFMRECLNVLHAKDLDMNIGIAGGLSGETLDLIKPLVGDFPDLSIDAEDRLRNDDDTLNLDLAQDYLLKSLEIFHIQRDIQNIRDRDNISTLKTGMTEEEFKEWKKDWYKRVPKCENFSCCHELMSCGIQIFCGDCSIYDTYIRDKNPRECMIVGCNDCLKKYECKDYKIEYDYKIG